MPALAIVMPVKDGAITVVSAITSVALQMDKECELIVVDDGSSDSTFRLCEDTAESFPGVNIRIVRNTLKAGAVNARNFGISISDSEFIASMDADDMSIYGRFKRQLDVFAGNTGLVCLGTKIAWFGEKTGVPEIIVGEAKVKTALGLFSPCCHPSLMYKRSSFNLVGGYLEDNSLADDYSLLSRLSRTGLIDNIPEILLLYRIHATQLSNARKSEMLTHMYHVVCEHHQNSGQAITWKNLLGIAAVLGPSNFRQSTRALLNIYHINKKFGRI